MNERLPELALPPPVNLRGNRPQYPLVHDDTAARDLRQEQQLFLDVWRKVVKIHDLRRAWLCDVGQAGQFG